ncbi:MAG TPA: threonine-phosphate decarboxylase [Lachnospiraceae bacterium]|nr:threonine-phosphate decarboxylase [Lachnospiraceae bacterium]
MEKLVHQHGGDLDAIERKYKIPKSQIIDFSGNINPLGFPQSVKNILAQNLDIISTYPDKNYTALRQSISEYTGAMTENITVGNGSTELISVFIKSVNAKKSIILGPAYSEYEHELTVIGSNFEYFPLEEEKNFVVDINKLLTALTADIDLFVVCNPNNPTGTAITSLQMEVILEHCKKNNTFVMVDETYIEFSDNLDEICSIPLTNKFNNLFVIRGVSKFFAAPGIRLGYGITSSAAFHTLLKNHQDPWSVNILASFAGEHLFTDKEYMHKTQNLISDERKKALTEFKSWKNIKAYDSSSNFILLKLLTNKITSAEIFEKLIVKKILIRDAASFAFLDNTYLRFCILMPKQNAFFINQLKKLVEN